MAKLIIIVLHFLSYYDILYHITKLIDKKTKRLKTSKCSGDNMINGENVNNINMNIKLQGNSGINIYKICKRTIDVIASIVRINHTLPTYSYCIYCK